MPKDFRSLIGKTVQLHGADNNHVMLNGEIWECVEDEDDGYRSALKEINHVNEQGKLIFHRRPFAYVKVVEMIDAKIGEYNHNFNGYQLVDVEDQHVWLVMGTDNTDDYYPSFVFTWTPKPEDKIRALKEISKFQHFNGETIN